MTDSLRHKWPLVFLQAIIVARPAKIGHVGTHNLRSYFFNFYIHKILSFDSTVMILSEIFHSLSGMLMQVNTVFRY